MSTKRIKINDKLKGPVKFKELNIDFSDPRANVFWNTLSLDSNFNNILQSVLHRVYYNVGFFMSSEPVTETIENYSEQLAYKEKLKNMELEVELKLNETIGSIEKAFKKTLDENDSKVIDAVNSNMLKMDKMVEHMSTMSETNKELMSIISSIQGSLSENKEVMDKLNSIQVSGKSINAIVKQNETVSQETETILAQAKPPTSVKPPETMVAGGSTNKDSEVDTKTIDVRKGKNKLKNLRERMKQGNS